MPSLRIATLFLRFAFFTLLAATLLLALAPGSAIKGSGVDKIQHFLAFYVLTVVGLAAFPRTNFLSVSVGMIAFGGLIEVLQGIHIFGRSQDFMDWLADIAGVGLALAPLLAARYRQAPHTP